MHIYMNKQRVYMCSHAYIYIARTLTCTISLVHTYTLNKHAFSHKDVLSHSDADADTDATTYLGVESIGAIIGIIDESDLLENQHLEQDFKMVFLGVTSRLKPARFHR